MDWQATITHAFDQDWVRYLLVPGLGAVAVALLGWQREHARKHRSDPDLVPWLPWRDISFWSSFAAVLLLIGAFGVWVGN